MHRTGTLVDAVTGNEGVVAGIDVLLRVVHVVGGLLVLLGRGRRSVGGAGSGLVSSLGSLRVDGLPLILDVSHITTVRAHVVCHCLDATVGKGNPVGSLEVAGTIVDLLLVKVGAGVGVVHSVLVVVGGVGLVVVAAGPVGLVGGLTLGRGRLEVLSEVGLGVLGSLVGKGGGGGKGQVVESLLETGRI